MSNKQITEKKSKIELYKAMGWSPLFPEGCPPPAPIDHNLFAIAKEVLLGTKERKQTYVSYLMEEINYPRGVVLNEESLVDIFAKLIDIPLERQVYILLKSI